MDDKQKWWDEFWIQQSSATMSAKDKDENWVDLVWEFNLGFWYDMFKTLAPGKKMLECGCGSAKVSGYMASRGYQCTLLDYSQKALNIGKSNFESLSLDGQFVIGDMNRLSFSDAQFDLVFSGGVLEFFEGVQAPINEMVRVLKPGGVFAANMVPRKLSIQTIADVERTLAHSLNHLIKGRFSSVLKRIQHIPPDYKVSSVALREYIDCCERAGLTSVVGLVTSPFPALALPRFAERFYTRLMKRYIRQWQQFNLSTNPWTEIWGITYTLYGIKN